MSRALAAALLSAVAAAACSTGVIDLMPPGASGGGGAGATASTGSSIGGATASSTSSQGGSAASASGTGAGGCNDQSCPCGLEMCLGACVDTANDPSFCGGCDMPCKHNEACENGQCACLPGFTMCSDGSCHQLASDPDHCGSCTHVCATAEACDNGTCKQGCTENRTACAVANSRLACVDLGSGEPYCGQCGNICGPTQVCSGQHCVDFKPATPCTTCPCTQVCAATYPAPATCCPGLAGGSEPICVHGDACPP